MNRRTRFRLVTGCGGALAVALALAIYHPNPLTCYLAIIVGILFLGSLAERFRYKKLEERRPRAGWVETDERFIDPATDKCVTVFYNPATGERLYVTEPGDPER